MSRLGLSLVSALLVCCPALAHEVSPHAREAVQVIRELRAIGLPDPDSLEKGPPAKVPGLLRQLNRQLLALVADTLNDSSRYTLPSEEEVTEQLQAAGWEEIPDNKWNAYGEIIRIKFVWKNGYEPNVLIVSSQLWIPCGSSDPDSAIYVFEGKARHWELVLAADTDFDTPGASQATGLRYELSPPDGKGQWFLAVANAPPSCRWTKTNLHYRVLRPGRRPNEPQILVDQREPIDQKFDPPFELRAEMDWFAVTRGKHRKLDGEPGVSIARYEVDGDRVQRIHPLALRPEDFVDEWVQLNWEDAKRWSNPSMPQNLGNWHAKLNSLEFDSTEIQFLQACPQQERLTSKWLIELWIDRKPNPAVSEELVYIVVNERNGIYLVDGIYNNRPGGCPGETPLPAFTDWKLPDW